MSEKRNNRKIIEKKFENIDFTECEFINCGFISCSFDNVPEFMEDIQGYGTYYDKELETYVFRHIGKEDEMSFKEFIEIKEEE